MKLVALVLCVCLLKVTSAQRDCQAAYRKSLADHDKFDIPARFVAFGMEGEGYDYQTYQAMCGRLMQDVHNVMDTVANELQDCPENLKRLDITKFDTDFFCSFDPTFKDSFFKNRESYTNADCMNKIHKQCSKEHMNYCNGNTVSGLIACANKTKTEACANSVEYFSRYLRFGQESSMCNRGYIFDRFLTSF